MSRLDRSVRQLVFVCIALCAIGAKCGPPAPDVAITSPVHGSFIDAGSVLVEGTVNLGVGSGAVLTVNGTVVPTLADKTWSTTVALSELLNPVEVVYVRGAVEDRERIVIVASESVADGQLSPESVALRVNDAGLDRLEETVGSLVNVDLGALVPVGLYVGSFGASYSDPMILDLDSATDAADVAIDLNGLYVDVFMDGFGAFDCWGNITTNGPMELDASFALEPQALDPELVDVTQVGSVSFGNTDFVLDITAGICVLGELFGLIPDIDATVTGALTGFLDTVDGEGNTALAAAIEDALSGIEISGAIGQGVGLQFTAPMTTVAEDDDGVTIAADSWFLSQDGAGPGECTIPAGAPDLTASYHVTEPFPTLGPLTPGGLPYQLGIGISSSAFSQLLKASTECGLMAVDLTEIDIGTGPLPVTPALLALFAPEFGALDPATPLAIRIRPTLAPIVSGAPGPAGELADLQIGQLRVEIVGNPGGEEYVLLGVVADLVVGLELALTDGGLAPTVVEPHPSDIDVFVLDNTIGTDPAAIELFLPFALAPLVPSLAGALAAFPLPEFFGSQLEAVEVGHAGDFLGLYVDLVDAPPAGTLITHDAFTVDNGTPPADYGDHVSASGGNYFTYTSGGITGTPHIDALGAARLLREIREIGTPAGVPKQRYSTE
jgi:hypothetical protein